MNFVNNFKNKRIMAHRQGKLFLKTAQVRFDVPKGDLIL